MARRAKLEPKNTDAGWMLNIPGRLTESGKRERHFFKTQALAKAEAKRLREQRDEFGHQALAISPHLAEQAHKAASMLEPLGVSLLDAVAAYVGRETRLRESKPIEEALAAFRHNRATVPRKGKLISDKQAKNYRLRSEKFIAAFAGRLVAEISGEEIEEHLIETTSTPGAFDEQLKYTRTIWKWFAKPRQGWVSPSLLDDIEQQGDDSGEIGVLDYKQSKALMAAAIKHQPETVPAFAIALFTGMRQSEISRLVPKDIRKDGVEVPALTSKGGNRRRFINMTPPLRAWLKAFPIGETVCPADWPRKYRHVRRMAGFRLWCDLAKPEKPPQQLPAWPQNALRHTAATMHLALGKPIQELIFEHGHTQGTRTLQQHYVGRMMTNTAKDIWALRPADCKTKRKAKE